MARDEIARWAGSIGIFYVLVPAYVVASERLYGVVLPAVHWPALSWWNLGLFGVAGVVGVVLIFASIRDQIRHGPRPPLRSDRARAAVPPDANAVDPRRVLLDA